MAVGCCTPAELAEHLDPERAERIARVAKALGDPVRVQLLDVLRGSGAEVCQCDLQPLFGIAQPTLSHHLRKLADAGLVRVRRDGRWAWYSLHPDASKEVHAWPS